MKIAVRPFFVPGKLRKRYERLSAEKRRQVLFRAREEARTNHLALDISPEMYAVCDRHFDAARWRKAMGEGAARKYQRALGKHY